MKVPGDPDEGGPEDEGPWQPPADGDDFRTPPPRDDRIWRHPSEALSGGIIVQARPAGLRTWAVAVLSGCVAAALTAIVLLAGGLVNKTEILPEVTIREQDPSSQLVSDTSGLEDAVEIAETVSEEVVLIQVEGDQPGTGSGVLFRDDGHILTNAHVVEGADLITVIMSDGDALTANLIGADLRTDLAVLKVPGQAPFPSALLGTAIDLRVGQPVVAIGSPLGLEGGASVSTGVISALGRQVDSVGGVSLFDMIQTDADIAPGSSGGALVDRTGAVIGITTAVGTSELGSEGPGFAVPIDIARSIGLQIINTGAHRAIHSWLGIDGNALPRTAAEQLGLEGGAVIVNVWAGSPAESAGLAEADIIVSLDGQPVRSMSSLIIALRLRSPGEIVRLGVLRDSELVSIPATLLLAPEILN